MIVWLSACGPDLAELETKERALERQVEVLDRNVADMRSRLQEMGVAPSGPAAGAGAEGGRNDLADRVRVKVPRQGQPPAMPALGAPERRPSTECGFRLATPWLEPLSDQTLEQSGSGKASPLTLAQ